MSSRTSVPKHPASKLSTIAQTSNGERISAAYDAIASEYDSQLADAHWIRERLWKRLDELFPAQSTILDVTAGTGLDAMHLAERGISVVACDLSSKMLDVLHKKNPGIKVMKADFNHIEIEGKFDGIISTFAGLNTSSDLRSFAERAAQLLRPGGILFIHLLNRWPVLDMARRFIRFRWLEAWNLIRANPRNVSLGNLVIPHYLYSPKSLYRSVFAGNFRLGHLEGQGFIRPLDVEWGEHLEGLENRLAARFPFCAFGIFFSLELIRR